MLQPFKTTRFGIIRHALTAWNVEKRIQGHKDSPLTADGKRQARKWGRLLKHFNWDRIIASDTGRALKTATLINETLKLPLETDMRLREQDWGLWTEMTEMQLQREFAHDLSRQIARGWNFCPPDGENRRQVWSRSSGALSESASRRPGTTILIVTHEGVIRSLIYQLSGRNFMPEEPPLIRPYHLHWLVREAGQLKIDQLNALPLE